MNLKGTAKKKAMRPSDTANGMDGALAPMRWAVVGVGTAGLARAQAILDDPTAELVAVHRGRNASKTQAPNMTRIQDAIDRAEAVAICSPPDAHAAQIEQVLRSGRHVVVEYPVATDHREARRLFGLARDLELILHVEHIELLGPIAAHFRQHIQAQEVVRILIAFQGAGLLELPGAAIPLLNVSRLHRVVDAAGPLMRVDEVNLQSGNLQATLTLTAGAKVEVAFRTGTNLRRHLHFEIETKAGLWVQRDRTLTFDGEKVDLPNPMSLFALDHAVASARMRDNAAPYVSQDRILDVLAVVDRLRRGEPGPLLRLG